MKRKVKTETILDKLLFEILPSMSSLLVLGSVFLQLLSGKSMGLYRDILYRNNILEKGLLGGNSLVAYKIIACIGIVSNGFMIVKLKNCFPKRYKRYFIAPMITGAILLLMMNLNTLTSLVAYPFMTVSILMMFILQNSRLIYAIIKLKH